MGTIADRDVAVVRLLGPVEVEPEGPPLAPRERALLARLAIDVGRTVGHDRLVDDLWADHPPASARNGLQVYVSHLRARLGRDAVLSGPAGYRLELAPDQVDSHRMERLVGAGVVLAGTGRAHEAVRALDEAGGLWRGDALADLTDYDFARLEASRLTDLRATALEHLAEALLETDQLDRLADELGAAVRAFPYRDRLRAAVMTGLYRQGRAVDALALYAQVVDELREELGLEPGPALKALQRAILADDAALMRSLPSGELTLVVASLDASTTLEAALGEAFDDAVLAHRDAVRRTLAGHGGSVVPTDPERLLAVFADATSAVRAAVAVQRALAAVTVAGTPLRTRVGVHTGSPRVLEHHYVGAEVRRVEEVASSAWGGQVVVTESAASLLDRETLDTAGVVLRDLGLHRLTSSTGPERLHEAAAVGSTTQFPPPRTVGGRGNLPRVAVPLVGRHRELQALLADAALPGSGLSTVVGTGGAGKTRLAVEVADRLGATYDGGVHFAALESTPDVTGFWPALGAALGLPPDARGAEAVLDRLADRRTFIVLDNLEQLADAGPAVEALLETRGEVRVLATSRRPLGVTGERLHRLEPFDTEPFDGEDDGDASRLFASYAALARPGFVLDEESRPAVADICRRLDGLPLAIELAAARTRHLAPRALAARLATSLDLVTGGAPRPGRHQGLRALTAWSYDLLEPPGQRLLQTLSVFAGGADLETLADLPHEADPVAEVLDLCDASLVRLSDGDEPRVSLLGSVQEFAREQLEQDGRVREARAQHLDAHVRLARRLHPRVTSPPRAARLLIRNRTNFEEAVAWALSPEGDAAEAAAEIVVCLDAAWHQLGTRAFELTARTSAALPSDSPLRGWLTYWDYRRRWDTETDERLLLELLEVAEQELRAAGDPAPLAALLAYGTDLGTDAGLGEEWGVVRAEEAVRLAEDSGDDWLLATALSSLASTLVVAGRWEEVASPLDRARAAAARRGDAHRLDLLTMLEAEVLASTGRRTEAWAVAAPAARALVSERSHGALWRTCFQVARLCAAEHPTAAAELTGIGLAALARMGSVPGPADHARLRASVSEAVDALGGAEFDRLRDEARGWGAEDAVARVEALLDETAPRGSSYE